MQNLNLYYRAAAGNAKLVLAIFLFAMTSCKQEVAVPVSQPVSQSLALKTTAPLMLGNQLELIVPTDQAPANALLYLPPNYDSNAHQRFPVIIELPGKGQDVSSIDAMIKNGICGMVAKGYQPSAVNPVDGKTYNFIVFSPQGPPQSWGWQASQVMHYMLPYLLKTYRIDTSRIYITGFSAGGWGAATFLDDDSNIVKKIAAVSPMGVASVDNPSNLYWPAKYGLAVWTIMGGADPLLQNGYTITNGINNNHPVIPAKLTVIPDAVHRIAWHDGYDPTWYDPADPKKLNLYEWFLQYKRNIAAK